PCGWPASLPESPPTACRSTSSPPWMLRGDLPPVWARATIEPTRRARTTGAPAGAHGRNLAPGLLNRTAPPPATSSRRSAACASAWGVRHRLGGVLPGARGPTTSASKRLGQVSVARRGSRDRTRVETNLRDRRGPVVGDLELDDNHGRYPRTLVADLNPRAHGRVDERILHSPRECGVSVAHVGVHRDIEAHGLQENGECVRDIAANAYSRNER